MPRRQQPPDERNTSVQADFNCCGASNAADSGPSALGAKGTESAGGTRLVLAPQPHLDARVGDEAFGRSPCGIGSSSQITCVFQKDDRACRDKHQAAEYLHQCAEGSAPRSTFGGSDRLSFTPKKPWSPLPLSQPPTIFACR